METSGDWAPRSPEPRRSVFGNYQEAHAGTAFSAEELGNAAAAGVSAVPKDATAELAFARSFIYRLLAKAFEDPGMDGYQVLLLPDQLRELHAVLAALAGPGSELTALAERLVAQLRTERLEEFTAAYLAAFGHAARGRCPLNEIEYGDIKADPLFQPHRLADLAAFYRAFGLELASDAGERHDHISIELEFMCVLAAKEAFALQHGLGEKAMMTCRQAQQKFLREHLARWAPAFSRRLARVASGTPLDTLAELLRGFVLSECDRLGVRPGSEDLLLRPVDPKAESLCASCGLEAPSRESLPAALPER